MPTPPRTSMDEIVAAGRRILEAEGTDALTMHAVADAVGVRAPSLYKHVRGRDDLVHRIAVQVAGELGTRLESATGSGDPMADLQAMADAYRSFARNNPRGYGLLFGPASEAWRIDDDLNVRLSAPLLRTTQTLAGAGHGLEAARLLVAWAHGFVTMELAGAFRLGGDVDDAFAYGVERLGEAIQADGAAVA